MAKKRKIRIDRVIILVLAFVLILGVTGFGVYKLFGLLFKHNQTTNNETIKVDTKEGIKISLVDYTVYIDDTKSLGFNFVIAKLKFDGSEAISFDLSNLQTSEKIELNNVSKYLDALDSKEYKLNELMIENKIVSDKNSYECNVFIPYQTNNKNLSVYNKKDPTTSINIDLDKNNKLVTTLKFKTDDQIIVENSSIRVASSYVSSIMKHNNEEYEIPSSQKVFTFIIYADSVEDNVSITDAYFIKDNESKEIKCMSNEYKSINIDNVLGKKLVKGENGALFFETYSRDDNPDYSGVLMIKFSNSNDWIKVSTTLE